MAVFDYKDEDASDYFSDLYALLFYSPAATQTGNLIYGHAPTGASAPGWQELAGDDLGVPAALWDAESGFAALSLDTQEAAVGRARVYGQYDEGGVLLKVNIAFSGMQLAQASGDIAQATAGYYVYQFNHLLWAVAGVAQSNGLTGVDVAVSGFSLGAAAVTNLFDIRETAWGGFYANADYFTHANLLIHDAEEIFNFGFENDVVFRTLGDGTPEDMLNGYFNGNDGPYISTPDNIVLFDYYYAAQNLAPGEFNIGTPVAWSAHFSSQLMNPVEIIRSSAFYDVMEKDSVIVIGALPQWAAPYAVVEDKSAITSDHFGDPAFILGGEGYDRLGDGFSDDFLEGRGGANVFYLGAGSDIVLGGDDVDQVVYEGARQDFSLYQALDGTVFVASDNAADGIDALQDVEWLTFGAARPTNAGDTSWIGSSGNNGGGSPGGSGGRADGTASGGGIFETLMNGSDTSDTLQGSNRGDAIYGAGGDDVLDGRRGDDLLLGGAGDDVLLGQSGADRLWGGFGDDYLSGGAGDDVLNGGTGSDVFDFSDISGGHDTVLDFNIHAHGVDSLIMAAGIFDTAQQVLDVAVEVDGHVVITQGGGSVTLLNTALSDLAVSMIDIG